MNIFLIVHIKTKLLSSSISELIYHIRDSNNVLKPKIIEENNLQMNKKIPFMNLNLKEKSCYIPVENLCLEGK